MATITFIHPDGSSEAIDAPSDESVMDAAADNDIDGLLGECGGNAMCATCHVYVVEIGRASCRERVFAVV